MSISLTDERSQTATLEQVTDPGTQTLRKLMEHHGYDQMLQVVTRLVQEADIALGGDGDPSRCVPTAANALIGNGHRGIGFLVVSIREGMKGKVYGNKITASLLNEWTAAQEQAVADMAVREHMKQKFVDNGGKDSLDREQYASEADKRKIQRLSAMNEMLRARLNTDKP